MELLFEKGTFIVPRSEFDFKDQLGSVPDSRWKGSKKEWHFLSTPESKATLLVYCQEGLLRPSPEALEELEEAQRIISLRQEVRGIKKESRVEVDVPLKVELFQHQKKAYKIGITLPRTALLMEQGTGKTLTSLAIAGHRYLNGEINRLLVVAPLSTLTPWAQEINKFVDYPVEIKDLSTKKGAKRAAMLQEFETTDALQIVLINHQSVWRIYPEIDDWNPDMIIVDESQKIKSGKAKQSKALHKLGDNTRYKLNLSGTPITQGPLDVWSQYRFLDPEIFGRSFFKFKQYYAQMGGFKNYKVVGYNHLDELAEKAHSIAFRVLKVDTEIDLPPITNQFLYAGLGKEARKLYKEMKKEFKITLKEHEDNIKAPIVLTQMLRLQQIAGGFVQVEEDEKKVTVQVDNAKLNLLTELVEDMPSEKKMVIFARFIPEVKAIAKSLREQGRKVVTLTGATKDRGSTIDQFTNDAQTTVIVAQIQTGGVGLNLQVADTAIFYSTNFSYGDFDQAKARIHRIGQKSTTVNYIHLIAQDTIDEKVFEALEAKRDVATHIVDTLK